MSSLIRSFKTWLLLGILAIGIVFFSQCEKDKAVDPNKDSDSKHQDTFQYNPTPYDLNIPNGFPEMDIPDENPMTKEGVKLGRMLYYDPILGTSGRSCNTCHKAEYSYSVPRLGPGSFAVPVHVNLGWNDHFTWTGAEDLLDHVAIIDLEVPDFIQPDMDTLKARLDRHDKYPGLFREAFGIDIVGVNVEKRKKYISYALAQFMRTMISSDSKYDRYKRGEANLTEKERKGMEIFFTEKGDCFHCHSSGRRFTDNKFHNIGLDSVFKGNDKGRYEVTGNKADLGAFKTPTLRNIELTAPYMHDNRFKSLREVVDFYSEGVQNTQYTDPLMKYAYRGGVQLTEKEKEDLIAFLKTLTDTSFVNNPKYQSPF